MNPTSEKVFPCGKCSGDWKSACCPNCGQKRLPRLSIRVLIDLIMDSFDLDRGILFNLRELTLRPGFAVKTYLDGYTQPFYNPIKYFLVALGIFAAISIVHKETVQQLFSEQVAHELISPSANGQTLENKLAAFYADVAVDEVKLMVAHLVVFIGFALGLTFTYKQERNFAENLAFILFVLGHTLYFHCLVWFIIMKVKVLPLNGISLALFGIYLLWGSKQLYQVSWILAISRSILIVLFTAVLLFAVLGIWFMAAY